MGISEEAAITIINGAAYEIFMIVAMYFIFEIMLHIEKSKRKAFFIIFFLDMLIINVTEIYIKYYYENAYQGKIIIAKMEKLYHMVCFNTKYERNKMTL